MHGLAIYVKEGLPFAWSFSLDNSVSNSDKANKAEL